MAAAASSVLDRFDGATTGSRLGSRLDIPVTIYGRRLASTAGAGRSPDAAALSPRDASDEASTTIPGVAPRPPARPTGRRLDGLCQVVRLGVQRIVDLHACGFHRP